MGMRSIPFGTLALPALVFSVTVATQERPSLSVGQATPFSMFLTLPMTPDGFSNATEALLTAKERVRDALSGVQEVRLVNRIQDADIILAVLATGEGPFGVADVDSRVVSPEFAVRQREHWIQGMLIVGPTQCDGIIILAKDQEPPAAPCHRRVFFGTEFATNASSGPSSWGKAAEVVAKDIRAWLIDNADTLHKTLKPRQ